MSVIFKADFGPLNTAVELSAEDGYEQTFGTGLTSCASSAFVSAVSAVPTTFDVSFAIVYLLICT